MKNGKVAIDDQLSDYVLNEYDSVETFTKSLIETGLIFEENGVLLPLTDQGLCVILPDGRLMVAENKSGRFSNWIANFMNRRTDQEST